MINFPELIILPITAWQGTPWYVRLAAALGAAAGLGGWLL